MRSGVGYSCWWKKAPKLNRPFDVIITMGESITQLMQNEQNEQTSKQTSKRAKKEIGPAVRGLNRVRAA